MNFQAGKPFYIVVGCLIAVLCLCVPNKIIVEPSPVGIEVTPNVAVNVQSAVPDVIVEPEINVVPNVVQYEQRYTEKLVNIAMQNKDYPYPVNSITSEYIDNGIWIVTVRFNDLKIKSKQYIFDEVNP